MPARRSVRFTATDRLHAFSMSGILFDTGWQPPPTPWYWRNRFTRWLLRLPPFRRLPPLQMPPLVFTLYLNGRIAAYFGASFLSMVRPHMFEIFDPILVTGPERIELVVENTGDEDLHVFVQAFGIQRERREVV